MAQELATERSEIDRVGKGCEAILCEDVGTLVDSIADVTRSLLDELALLRAEGAILRHELEAYDPDADLPESTRMLIADVRETLPVGPRTTLPAPSDA